jgi:hypothetical protein
MLARMARIARPGAVCFVQPIPVRMATALAVAQRHAAQAASSQLQTDA